LDDLIIAVISIICFLPAIIVHEIAHGYAALKMGDTTARDAKRLTLNPLRHVDPFGTVMLPLMLLLSGLPVFGYAKPVPYNPTRFKDIKLGELVVGLAGPTSNLAMALVGVLAGRVVDVGPYLGEASVWAYTACFTFTLINLCLMFFNLLPIPPLDGSSIIMPMLPRKAIPTWYAIQRYSMPIVLVLVVGVPYVTGLLGHRIDPLSAYIEFTAVYLTRLLFGF
jgi:Zn-dependent protease